MDDYSPPGLLVVPLSSTPGVRSGGQITRGKYGTGPGGQGTAGLIVRKTGAASGAHVLTCAHVLGHKGIGAAATNADAVYSPKHKDSSGLDCNRPFGQVVPDTLEQRVDPGHVIQAQITFGDQIFAVDAALIELFSNAQASNKIEDIGAIAGVRDLVQEWTLTSAPPPSPTDPRVSELPAARQITVRKFGATTELTHGSIKRLVKQAILLSTPGGTVASEGWVMEIEPLPAQPPFEAEYELDMDRFAASFVITKTDEVLDLFKNTQVTATIAGSAKTPTLKIKGRVFSQRGDSGAPVVDAANHIVGIVRSGKFQQIFVKGEKDPVEVATGHAQAVFIRAALETLGVAFLPAGQNTAGALQVAPGMAIERPHHESVDWKAVDHAHRAVERTRAGALLGAVVRRHFDELRQLVHHRRRVTVTWHRQKGPAFIATFLRASRVPGWPIPRAIEGVELVETLRAMRNVLMAEGSYALRSAIAQHEDEILGLAERADSVEALVRAWGPPTVTAHACQPLHLVNARGVPGTAGALVHDDSGRSYLLTSYHVLFGAGASTGDVVWAFPFGAADDATKAIAIGYARHGQLGRVTYAGETYFVDCALIELVAPHERPVWLNEALARWPHETAPPTIGQRVVKHGASTGTTEGVVVDAAYRDEPFIDGRDWDASGQLLVDSSDPELLFAGPGDSGATVLNDAGGIVGVLWGSNNAGQGLACPIEPVLDCLGVRLQPNAQTSEAATGRSA